ncbi:MAG: EamA family transporter [Gammaproteobacteria bacterium]
MPLTALALVGVAALLHAAWNLWMKRAGVGGGMVFVWGTTVVSALGLAPLAWLAGAFSRGGSTAQPTGAPEGALRAAADATGAAVGQGASIADWPASVWIAVAISVVVHTAYFRVLQRGYGAGDLSIVYPVARGTGPLLASLVAIVWLGESAGPGSLAGLALVVFGTLTVAGGGALLRAGASPTARRGLAWGVGIGVLIAGYTVNDGRAVSLLGAHPLVFYWAICVLQAVVLAPWVMRGLPGWRRLLVGSWPVVLGVGLLSPLSYVLVLEAMRQAPISVVAPARELSMLIAALVGATVLGEGQLGRRLAGSALIATGVALLATAG